MPSGGSRAHHTAMGEDWAHLDDDATLPPRASAEFDAERLLYGDLHTRHPPPKSYEIIRGEKGQAVSAELKTSAAG